MVVLATQYIGRKVADGSLKGVTALPTGSLAASECAFYGVPVAAMPAPGAAAPLRVDVMLEQPDEIDDHDGTLPFIKARTLCVCLRVPACACVPA
jgi:hypothetical protein